MEYFHDNIHIYVVVNIHCSEFFLTFLILLFNFDIIVAGKIPRIKRSNPYNGGIRNPMQYTHSRTTTQIEGI